jgi:hypothetical protein
MNRIEPCETLFVFATYFEARSLLDRGGYKKIKRNIFRKENHGVLISGIGRQKVEKAVAEIAEIAPGKVINLGFCAAVRGAEIGQVIAPETILVGSELHYYNNRPSSILISLDRPLKNRDELFRNYPFLKNIPTVAVDMEAGFLKIKLEHDSHIVFQAVKVVSDLGFDDFHENFLKRKDVILENLKIVALEQQK